VKRPTLTPELIESFAGVYLSPMYDNPQPVADFHREVWELYCQDWELAGGAAPRGHAKSTALTHVFALAVAMFRVQDYIIVVSATETLAMDHLGDIAAQLRENEDLRRDFQIVDLPVDAKGEIVVRFADGHMCRFLAKGSGQKMRGLKWRGRRPGLIIGDDLEEDEQVENHDRRLKFQRWVNRALIPCKRKGGLVRIHGTILHEDSYLARMQRNSKWKTFFYAAHAGFDDFTGILWPEQFSEEDLRGIRQRYIDDNDSAGYSQEYLNDPFDNSEAYLQRPWFLPMREEDHTSPKTKGVGVDFAISRDTRANRTSFTVGGVCAENRLSILDQYLGRMDSLQIIDTFFDIQETHRPDFFFVENGHIWQTIETMLKKEMVKRGVFINYVVLTPSKDKGVRGRALQKRMRAGGVAFNKDAAWYPAYENELLRFTGTGDAKQDDQFDSTALLALGFEQMPEMETEDFMDESELDDLYRSESYLQDHSRNPVTGY